MTLAENLRRIRRGGARISQAALAERAGVSQQLISQIERGENESTTELPAIAGALSDMLGRPVTVADLDPEYASVLPGPVSPPDAEFRRVPLLDWVSAGRLSEPRSQIPIEDVPLLAFADLGRGEFFALKVGGDSMDRVSPDGSVIVVNRADRTLVSGKAYVFSIRGETTYKLWQDGDPPYLAPHSINPIHKPIFPHRKREMEVIGRVRRTVLDL